MITRSSRSRWIVVAIVAFALAAGIVALSPGSEAKIRPIVLPPEDCSSCPPSSYIGPNGGVCEPLGCIRPGGACFLAGDCF